jgi:hypothetical protein
MILEKLKYCAQAIAQPTQIQVTLFPSFVIIADQLALDWEEATIAFSRSDITLTMAQRSAMQKLDDYMGSVSGPDFPHVWIDEGWYATEEWKMMRELATQFLLEMNWSVECPPSSNDIYVGPSH